MKFNLPLYLFFLFLLGRTEICLAQESTKTEIASPLPTTHDHQTHEQTTSSAALHSDYSDLPDVIINRIENETDTFQSKFLNMLFLLALLIGFMILASWALKRLMRTKISSLNTASTIKIVETRYLSPRATLYLVEIQNRTILIAESPTSVACLATLPQESDKIP